MDNLLMEVITLPFFKEFVVQVEGEVTEGLHRLLQAGYHAGLPLGQWYSNLDPCVGIAVTEKRTKAEIDGLVKAYTPYHFRSCTIGVSGASVLGMVSL